jgi:ubiquitin
MKMIPKQKRFFFSDMTYDKNFVLQNTRNYSPISCKADKKQNKKSIYETEICLIGHEFDSEVSSSDLSFTSNTDSTKEQRFGLYDEEYLNDFDKPKKINQQITLPEVFDNFKGRDGQRRTYIRRITAAYLEEVEKQETNEDEEDMELNGDYILKRALLKGHDVQLLRTKEMQHVLSQCCRIHLGRDPKGKKIIQIYKKPEVKEVTEEEINSIVVNFMRNLRINKMPKKILDTIDDIQQKIEKICPFGSMVKILYKYEDTDKPNQDLWFMPNREEVETGIIEIKNFMNFFEIATEGIKPVLIKDVFTTDYQKEIN